MKNKKILIIAGVIGGLIIIGVLVFFLLQNNKTFTVTFDSNGGTKVEKKEVKKGTIITLPKVTKKDFNFVGWFDGNTKVTTNLKVTKNITLKAKWISVDAKTYTVTFDSDGGSKVEDLVVECEKELKLPENPTKEGYEFVSWVDKNETPILDGALLTCENITLKANWKKVEEKKEEKKEETKNQEQKQETKPAEKQKTYSCSEGELSGDKCIITKDATYGCDIQHEKEYKGKCYSVRTYKAATCKVQDGSTGSGSSIQPILVDGIVIYKDSINAYCAYQRQSSLSACDGHPELIINGSNCYKRVETRPVTTVCPTGYEYVIGNALYGTIEKGTGASTGCYSSTDKHYICDSDYTLSGNKCTKTINATAN